jgi:ferrous iron transport protein A
MPQPALTLSDLRPGERGQVVEILGSDGVSARLSEMGFLPGEVVEMVGRAPMGDPIEFLVLGYRVSLRNVEASRVCMLKVP